jgi:hypothetical protein
MEVIGSRSGFHAMHVPSIMSTLSKKEPKDAPVSVMMEKCCGE